MEPHFLFLFLFLIGAGGMAGFSAGLFGIGGGIILVPALMTIFLYLGAEQAVVMHNAVGTSLALIVPTSFMASRKQYQMGKLDLRVYRNWIFPVALGVVAGGMLLNRFSSLGLKILFTLYLLAVTCYALVKKNQPEGGAERTPGTRRKILVGFLIGGLSVLLGIGGGTFTVPYWKFSGYPIHKAIALSSATGLVIGLGGALGTMVDGWSIAGRAPYSLGFVQWPAFLIITPLVMIFAPLGARTANAIPAGTLKWVYTGFLAVVTAYMAFQVFGALK